MQQGIKGSDILIKAEFQNWLRITNILNNYKVIANIEGWHSSSGSGAVIAPLKWDSGIHRISILSVFVTGETETDINADFSPKIERLTNIENDTVYSITSLSTSTKTFQTLNRKITIRSRTYTTPSIQALYKIAFHPVYDFGETPEVVVNPIGNSFHSCLIVLHRDTKSIVTSDASKIEATAMAGIVNFLKSESAFLSFPMCLLNNSDEKFYNKFNGKLTKTLLKDQICLASRAEMITDAESSSINIAQRIVTAPGSFVDFFINTPNVSASYIPYTNFYKGTLGGNTNGKCFYSDVDLNNNYINAFFTYNSDATADDLKLYLLNLKLYDSEKTDVHLIDHRSPVVNDPLDPTLFAYLRRIFNFIQKYIVIDASSRIADREKRVFGCCRANNYNNDIEKLCILPYRSNSDLSFSFELGTDVVINFDFYEFIYRTSNFL